MMTAVLLGYFLAWLRLDTGALAAGCLARRLEHHYSSRRRSGILRCAARALGGARRVGSRIVSPRTWPLSGRSTGPQRRQGGRSDGRSLPSRAFRLLPPGRSCASWRNRVTSRTVRRPLPHQSTASSNDRPCSMVMVWGATPGAPFRVADRGVAFTQRGQHGDCQTLQPAVPDGPLFAQ